MSERLVNNDYDGDTTMPRSAGLLIELFPVDKPGTVGLAVHNVGPEPLTQDEAVRTLITAAVQLSESATWRG